MAFKKGPELAAKRDIAREITKNLTIAPRQIAKPTLMVKKIITRTFTVNYLITDIAFYPRYVSEVNFNDYSANYVVEDLTGDVRASSKLFCASACLNKR